MSSAPSNADDLNERAAQLYRSGRVAEALALFEEVVRRKPGDARARANLGFMRMQTGDPQAARTCYAEALRLDARLVQAHHGLAAALERLGDPDGCAHHFDEACRLQPIRHAAYRGSQTPVRVLLMLSVRMGNIDTRPLLDDRVFAVTSLFVEHAVRAAPLPAHDVVFVGIGDADQCAAAFDAARELLEKTSAPVFNAIARVAATRRDANAERMRGLASVHAPVIRRVRRDAIGARPQETLHGFAYPLLLRSPGFHNGRHFVRIERPEEIRSGIAELPGDELYAIEFVDLRGSDGNVRKYRAIIVDGTLFPLHLAIATRWKVHYQSADMTDVAEHRAEEKRFLDDMAGTLGERAMSALRSIARTLGLDYGGIDFGIDGAGDVVMFEANAAMLVPAVPPDPRWAYREPAVRRIRDAVAGMVQKRASSGASQRLQQDVQADADERSENGDGNGCGSTAER